MTRKTKKYKKRKDEDKFELKRRRHLKKIKKKKIKPSNYDDEYDDFSND